MFSFAEFLPNGNHLLNTVTRQEQSWLQSRHRRHDRTLAITTIRYDTIEEFNVDSKAEYTAS